MRTNYKAGLDKLQTILRPFLKKRGFRCRGRTFNRRTADGVTQVIALQMGRFDPPGTTTIPGFRENMYGRFTVNVGVYVPEVARYRGDRKERPFVQEYDCCVRSRLGELGPEHRDIWWPARYEAALARELLSRVEQHAMPFLTRFESRDNILQEWKNVTESTSGGGPPRVVCAIILAGRRCKEEARQLLAAQALETDSPGHSEYVRRLAQSLGVGSLDG